MTEYESSVYLEGYIKGSQIMFRRMLLWIALLVAVLIFCVVSMNRIVDRALDTTSPRELTSH
jgi:4-hydroxybenzoate polyprenyltransferase